jgi:hypothetical protein
VAPGNREEVISFATITGGYGERQAASRQEKEEEGGPTERQREWGVAGEGGAGNKNGCEDAKRSLLFLKVSVM